MPLLQKFGFFFTNVIFLSKIKKTYICTWMDGGTYCEIINGYAAD